MTVPTQPEARGDALAFVPPVWLAVVMLYSVWGIVQSWPLAYEFGLPDSVMTYIYASLAASAVTFLWGLWPLALALGRSPAFGGSFVPWQVAVIAISVAAAIYVLVTPEFVDTLRSIVFSLAEIAIGVFCIAIVRRQARAPAPLGLATTPAAPPSAIVTVVGAVLGLIVGGAVGAGAGLLAGSLIADVTDMSCFEGACGFFALFVGLGGLLVGAIGGAILAMWCIRRRPTVKSV
jgi:hypothetical protein